MNAFIKPICAVWVVAVLLSCVSNSEANNVDLSTVPGATPCN